jgi:hypothetical protein
MKDLKFTDEFQEKIAQSMAKHIRPAIVKVAEELDMCEACTHALVMSILEEIFDQTEKASKEHENAIRH